MFFCPQVQRLLFNEKLTLLFLCSAKNTYVQSKLYSKHTAQHAFKYALFFFFLFMNQNPIQHPDFNRTLPSYRTYSLFWLRDSWRQSFWFHIDPELPDVQMRILTLSKEKKKLNVYCLLKITLNFVHGEMPVR